MSFLQPSKLGCELGCKLGCELPATQQALQVPEPEVWCFRPLMVRILLVRGDYGLQALMGLFSHSFATLEPVFYRLSINGCCIPRKMKAAGTPIRIGTE